MANLQKIEARGRVRRVKHTGLIDKDTQDSFVQTAPSKYESDGNRFSSLKAKNILRFSVIPPFRETSARIIANFLSDSKWASKQKLRCQVFGLTGPVPGPDGACPRSGAVAGRVKGSRF